MLLWAVADKTARPTTGNAWAVSGAGGSGQRLARGQVHRGAEGMVLSFTQAGDPKGSSICSSTATFLKKLANIINQF